MSEYTLVRHSAYAIAGNADFESAVEVCELSEQLPYRVRAAGGLLFPTRDAAQSAATAANFPNGPTQATPNAAGYFSSLRIGGAEIYLPRANPASPKTA